MRREAERERGKWGGTRETERQRGRVIGETGPKERRVHVPEATIDALVKVAVVLDRGAGGKEWR